jgi:hypothetical protein
MKRLINLLLLAFLILPIGCSEENSTNPANIKKYPDSLGTEWEYQTTFIFVFYDSSGNIYGHDTLDVGNTIAKVIKNNDSLGNYINLTLFASYDAATPENIAHYWYNNSEDGLYLIAYSSAGASQPILPKGNSILSVDQIVKLLSAPVMPMVIDFHPGNFSNSI